MCQHRLDTAALTCLGCQVFSSEGIVHTGLFTCKPQTSLQESLVPHAGENGTWKFRDCQANYYRLDPTFCDFEQLQKFNRRRKIDIGHHAVSVEARRKRLLMAQWSLFIGGAITKTSLITLSATASQNKYALPLVTE